MAQHEEVDRKAAGSPFGQQKGAGEVTHRDAEQERSSNDGGGAFEGGKRQRGMRETGVGSDFHVEIVSAMTDAACGMPVRTMEAAAGVVPEGERG